MAETKKKVNRTKRKVRSVDDFKTIHNDGESMSASYRMRVKNGEDPKKAYIGVFGKKQYDDIHKIDPNFLDSMYKKK